MTAGWTAAQANHEQDLGVIHRDTIKREREAVMQINNWLLTPIMALWKAQQRIIELSAREAQVNKSSEIHQQLSAPIDLCFKLI